MGRRQLRLAVRLPQHGDLRPGRHGPLPGHETGQLHVLHQNDDTPPGGTSSTIVLRGEVYAWDGTKASGRGLWESAPRSLTVSGPFEEVSFDTGGLRLKAGRTYVLFASVSKDFDDNPGGPTGYEHQTCWGYTFANSYAGGGWVFQNNGDDVSQWTGSPWETFEDGTGDLAFKAEFSARGRSDKHLAR